MSPAHPAWNTLSLDDILAQAKDAASSYEGVSMFTKLLFHALHERGWGGCLFEQAIVNGRSSYLFYFLRWQGKTLNIKGETLPQCMAVLRTRKKQAVEGLSRVLTAPDTDIVDLVASLPADADRARAVVEALFLAQTTPPAAAHAPPNRL